CAVPSCTRRGAYEARPRSALSRSRGQERVVGHATRRSASGAASAVSQATRLLLRIRRGTFSGTCMGTKDLFPASSSTEPPARPSRVRYAVLAFLCTLAFILYLDRICISKAAPAIERELGISHTAMGFVFGAFTVSYGLFEIPTGRWGDRYGSRGVLMRIVIWWSVCTVVTGCVWRFTLDSGFRLRLPWCE